MVSVSLNKTYPSYFRRYGSVPKSYWQILDPIYNQGLRLCLGAFKTSPVESLYIEGRKEMFYLTMHSTHFIYGYMASHMVKNPSDSERGNLLPPHLLHFLISSKGSFICIIPQTG